MSVTVIRPELTPEEREERMKEVERRVAEVGRHLQQAEKPAEKKRAKPEYNKTCAVCGEKFISGSPNAKYCLACRETGRSIAKNRYKAKNDKIRREEIRRKYAEGVIFVCSCCGRKIRVHERTHRKICDHCLGSLGQDGMHRVKLRKDIKEEVVKDV